MFALKAGIGCFNVESPAELDLLECVGQEAGLIAPASVRVNPDVDAGTHPYIATGLKENKFGVSRPTAVSMYIKSRQMKYVNMIGIDCHIGSQITEIEPIIEAITEIKKIIDDISNLHLELGKIKIDISNSWLNPTKERLIRIIGKKKMLSFDEMNNKEPLKIYDQYAKYPDLDYFDKSLFLVLDQ